MKKPSNNIFFFTSQKFWILYSWINMHSLLLNTWQLYINVLLLNIASVFTFAWLSWDILFNMCFSLDSGLCMNGKCNAKKNICLSTSFSFDIIFPKCGYSCLRIQKLGKPIIFQTNSCLQEESFLATSVIILKRNVQSLDTFSW